MANLKDYQEKITLGRLYRARLAPNREPFKPDVTIQSGTVDIYIAQDNATTPNTNPSSLASMSQVEANKEGGIVFENGSPNFLAVIQNTGTSSVFVTGLVLEDLGAIS